MITLPTEREALERKLRRLSIEKKLAVLKNKNKTVFCSRQNEVIEKVVRVAPSGNSLGTFNGLSDLDIFLSRFNNCVGYYYWNSEDQLFQLRNYLIEAAGLLLLRLGTKHRWKKSCDF